MNCAVAIRPYEPGDTDAIFAAVVESRAEIGIWMPWCHPNYQRSDAEAWVQTTQRGRAEATMYDFAIIADGAYAGGCGINRISWFDRVANLGYWVRTPVTGRGVATQAARAVLDWTFAETNLNRIEIIAATANVASQRVAEKLGATRDAVLRRRRMVNGKPADAILYSILRPE